MKYIEIKIDRTSLPKDKQQIRWQTHEDFDKGVYKSGVFEEGDDLFCEGFEPFYKKWDLSQQVLHWKPLKEPSVLKNITNVEIIAIRENNGKKTAIISYQNLIDITNSNNGYDWIEVPVNIRDLQKSSRGNLLVNQSEKGIKEIVKPNQNE